jgi:hypothetical protein
MVPHARSSLRREKVAAAVDWKNAAYNWFHVGRARLATLHSITAMPSPSAIAPRREFLGLFGGLSATIISGAARVDRALKQVALAEPAGRQLRLGHLKFTLWR